ncbi:MULTISPECIES: McrB family protein [unclassified Methylococcus]|uniref:McrB family protein n=1 Tax=unclassified Methylococcus TaxID=2618889 RepID=UPI003D7E25C3
MTVWKLGIDVGCSSYLELSARNVVAQGWHGTGDLSFLFGPDTNKTERWLKKLRPMPDTAKAQRTLTNLLSKIGKGDIIIGYQGNTIVGICQIPDDFVYIYEDYHASCVTCSTPGHCEYAHCLFPVNWVDWSIFTSNLPHGTSLPALNAGQGIPGIVENHDNSPAIEKAWDVFVKKYGHSVAPASDSLTAEALNQHQQEIDKKRIECLKQMSCQLIKARTEHLEEVIKVAKQLIFYGPPGTGKTYLAKALAAKLLKLNQCNADAELTNRRFGNGNGSWDIVQFHPSYCYEDFVGGIRPDLKAGTLRYTLVVGIFKKICDAARRNPTQNYVLILDEINRANLPAVLGELLYALEYRGQPVRTPNNGNIVVPENLYIIGTMNNIDKSLVTFDVALQRRFAFEYLDSDIDIAYAVLYHEYHTNPTALTQVDDYIDRCRTVSNKIMQELHLPSDRPIGHSYFIRIKDYINQGPKNSTTPLDEHWKDCRGILWDYHILPLLEEYLGKRYADGKNILDDIRQRFVD